MSRSYKKNPVVKDKDKWYHRHHNKRVRQQKIDVDGVAPRERKLFKKFTQPYDISDWVLWWSKSWIGVAQDKEKIVRK